MSKMEPTATDTDMSRLDTDLMAPIDERIERIQVQGVNKAVEKKLLWKLDTRILPLITVMYLFKSVLRSVLLFSASTNSLV